MTIADGSVSRHRTYPLPIRGAYGAIVIDSTTQLLISRPNRSILRDHTDKLPVTVTHLPVWLEPANKHSMRIAHPAVRSYLGNSHLVLIPDSLARRTSAKKHRNAYGNYFEQEFKTSVI